MSYDYTIDRLDVAVRAVWWLWKKRHWHNLEAIGLSEASIDKPFSQARFHWPRTEAHVFALLRLSPVVLPAALELLRRYEDIEAVSRAAFYKGESHAHEAVPHSL
jgi:hypothetical protein